MKKELIKIWKIENTSEVKSNSRVNSKYNKCAMGWNSTKRTSKIKLKDPIICIPIKKNQEILSKRILKPLIRKKANNAVFISGIPGRLRFNY